MSKETLEPCPFCGLPSSFPQNICGLCGASTKTVARWNTRPIDDALRARVQELEAIKAEQDYIIKQCESWESGENGCPKCENPNFPCWAEKDFYPSEDEPSFEPEFCEDEDGCWVEYYRWKYRQKHEKKAGEKMSEERFTVEYKIGYAEGQRDAEKIKVERAVKEADELRARVQELEAMNKELGEFVCFTCKKLKPCELCNFAKKKDGEE